MNKTLMELIEEQINCELAAAYNYFDIAEFYRFKGLEGFHRWFKSQALEELDHAEKLTEYLHDQGERLEFTAISAPRGNLADCRDPLLRFCEYESATTASITRIHHQAQAVNDVSTVAFMHWFVIEQLEEEKMAKSLLERFELFAKNGGIGLYQMDKDLASRKR